MPLLRALLDLIFPPTRAMEVVRALTHEQVHAYLAPTSSFGITSLMPYRTRAVGALIREAKFKGNTQAWKLLAAVLTTYLNEYLGDRLMYEERTVVLVPIPLSKKRVRARGFNQVEEVLKRVSLPDVTLMPRILRRTRDTKAQTSLSRRARLTNIEGAFTAVIPNPAYLYIVIDDVATTGATLNDAARALTQAGARHVHLISLSH